MRKKLLHGLILCLFCFSISSCLTTFKSIVYGVPDIKDHKRFLQLPVGASNEIYRVPQIETTMDLPSPKKWALSRSGELSKAASKHHDLEGFLKATETTAFIVMKNDTIVYEKYFNGYEAYRPSQVFSITKAVMSALVGIAIKEGSIEGVNQPISDFMPEFYDEDNPITFKHLLQMTAGFDYDDYKIVGHMRKIMGMYYVKNQADYLDRVDQVKEAGEQWTYSSYATLVMGLCLQEAVGMKVNEYLAEKIWKPMGAEFPATWSAHKDSVAKMYGGLVTVARDLVKFGQIYANGGKLNGEQIVPEAWVQKAGEIDTTNGAWWGYNYCWWTETYSDQFHLDTEYDTEKRRQKVIPPKTKEDFFAAGFRGQTVYVDPQTDLVVVRLGKKSNGVSWGFALSYLGYHLERVFMDDSALK